MASDAFVVGEDWISDHYFGTDSAKQSFQGRVIARRKDWAAREDAGESTPRSRLAAARGDLVAAVAELSAALAEVDDAGAVGADRDAASTARRRVLGQVDAGLHRSRVLEPLASVLGYASSAWHCTEHGSLTVLAARDTPDAPAAALVFARPVADLSDLLAKNEPTLLQPFTPDGEAKPIESVARALSWVFAGEHAPAFAVVLAGAHALVAEQTRWAEGRYLAVDVQLVLDRGEITRRGGEFDRAVAILAAESLLPAPDGTVWWAETLEDAVTHTVGVSKDLREGVRRSIEIVANEVVDRRRSQGLDALPQEEAPRLARQAMRYLYRILFLLYAEASPEMHVVPVGTPEYALGYGLDRLRELVLVPLGEESRHRTHLHESLVRLFRLVDAGHGIHEATADAAADLPEGLTFNPLNADLFAEDATSLIDETGLGDGAVQQVLELLLLTPDDTKRRRDRGFISYADLGINQLGAVYEGLMSYTGFFAEDDLFEVAKDGDNTKGSWVVPVSRSAGIAAKDFVLTEDPHTGEKAPRRYRGGEFVYRLSGRQRQTSASYYSPEVLTRFTVGQALEELLDQDGHTTTAAEILELSVCEPALGSGAFAIEAVRQLAEEYLTRRENEVGRRIDPDERPAHLQRTKAVIALHQVYGVDLNATAIELAEISMWLDTMVDGLKAPWFGLRLRRGNSLVGARRAVYTEKQVKGRAWLKDAPADVPVSTLVDDMRAGRVGGDVSGRIHHFLLPAEGWGAAVDAKEAKTLASDARSELNTWRKSVRRKPDARQLRRLKSLALRVETLWQFTLRRLEIAEAQVRREVALWNDPRPAHAQADVVTRAEIETFLNDEDGAYRRLRRVMDAWCALWFWPLTDSRTGGAKPPTLDGWLDGLEALLGVHVEIKPKAAGYGAQTIGLPTTWGDLALAEKLDRDFAGAADVVTALAACPWLVATQNIADQQGFFHWQLDFAGVFARGGFDLQLGNPPWVRPRSDVDALLAEGDPWWQLKSKATQAEEKAKRAEALELPGIRDLVIDGTADVASTAAFVGSPTLYPHLAGLQPDLYRCFTELTWRHTSSTGSVGLIHPETHFTDEKAGTLRQETYRRLRRHWQFINELTMFDIHHLVSYGVHVYGRVREPQFIQATSIYHPSTVLGSLKHDGSGVEPGLKDENGNWDLRPHASRIQHVDKAVLATWHAILENDDVSVGRTRMVYTVNRSTAAVLAKLAGAPRIGDLGLQFSAGWHETNDRAKGYFDVEWGTPESWDQVILQGPHIHVANPFYKSPNPTMLHNQDWNAVDLETLAPDAIPTTSYKPRGNASLYDRAYTQWDGDSARDHYRVAWRKMAANTGERTLISTVIPPGAAHIDGVFSLGFPDLESEGVTVDVGAQLAAMTSDFLIRAAPKNNIRAATIALVPLARNTGLRDEVRVRYLRLISLTDAYAPIWQRLVGSSWSRECGLHNAQARRDTLMEIDALVALSLGVTADELCAVYRTQFPVLYGYDHDEYLYDAVGRLVPTPIRQAWKRLGEPAEPGAMPAVDRTAAHPGSGVVYTYELPFRHLDREADMRAAYATFEAQLATSAQEDVSFPRG